ncbi:MAG: T9SS type A sorting domain-containing protein [Dyadobacter sp.]|uniref:T9SS type A sorting domain-containing protein n=1 Tax=Dyadobacter sp. TaxID=1914288 RepID=UPI001B16608A|nr:T9SS type A sorting domain-containing protein [Dyadobacter sp.]MBO9611309.1 T9SS type A sorting domain-containing protein [Dyadobacter sp.]
MKTLYTFCVQKGAPFCRSVIPPLSANFSNIKRVCFCIGVFIIACFDDHLLAQNCTAGGANLGRLTDYLFVFTDASADANWQGATKGFVGNVAVSSTASFRTSGGVPYAGTIYTNGNTIGAWNNIVSDNSGQASASLNQTALLTQLTNDFNNALTQINGLTPTPGYSGVNSSVLDGLNTQNGIGQTYVIHINAGMGVSSQLTVSGDANDFFVIVWDQDNNPANGYQGQVKFQSGGAIVPAGNLSPANFINVAGDIKSSGGGNTPASPYPQGPRVNNGTGALIAGGADFSGGGFFTGYWLTTGDENGNTSSLSNGIFVGGWYSSTNQFSMTSGTSGVYVAPSCLASVSGNIFHDPDGAFVNNSVSPAGPNVIPAGISAYLVKDGIAVAKTAVGTDGQFHFPNVLPGAGYTVKISATDAALGGAPPVATLPGDWLRTGAYNGDPNTGNSGSSGTSQSFQVVNTDVININFGIQRPPLAQSQSYTYPTRPKTGERIVLSGTGTGVPGDNASPGPLRGSDPEDLPLNGPLQNRKVAIKSLADHGVLIYNNQPVVLTNGQYIIENYDPALLAIELTDGTYASMSFQYAFIDKAGAQSPPATYTIVVPTTPLPVTLVAFRVTLNENQPLLSWETTFESNSDFFEIQHSQNGKDWHVAGQVSSHGESASLLRYHFVHTQAMTGTNYYRLRMVDHDGSFAFSKILALEFKSGLKLSVYPNPVSDRLNIAVDRPEAISRILIYTSAGQLVKDLTSLPQKGIDVTSLVNGIYILKAHYDDGGSVAGKILISR